MHNLLMISKVKLNQWKSIDVSEHMGKNSVNGFHGAAKLDVNRITFRKENNLITSRDEHLRFQLTLL